MNNDGVCPHCNGELPLGECQAERRIAMNNQSGEGGGKHGVQPPAPASQVVDAPERLPLCAVHKRLDDTGRLEVTIGGLGCIACSLNERQELLTILGPCAPAGNTKDSVTVLREVVEFYQTHVGENRVVVSYPAADLATAQPSAEMRDVLQIAQGMLTALNVGDVESESKLHLKLREVMIAYRAAEGR